MKTKILFCLLSVIPLSKKLYAGPPSMDDGKTIFSNQCAACHSVNTRVVGPALANVDQRHSVDWIINFVHSSQSLVKANDKQAVALFDEYKIVMPDHSDLTGEQVKSVLAYIRSQAQTTPTVDAAPFERPGKLMPAYIPIAITNYGFFATYLVLVSAMVGCFLFAVRVKEMQRESKKH